MNKIIILSPLLRERFEKIVGWCENNPGDMDIKPDNIEWDEIAFVRMCVVMENYFMNGLDLVH